MEQKLTAQILFAYSGAEVMWRSNKYPVRDWICGYASLIPESNLILHRLEDLTDEDAIEGAKMGIGDMCRELVSIKRSGKISITFEYGISQTTFILCPPAKGDEYGREYFYMYNQSKDGIHVISVFAASKIIDYLRSKGYDLGYGDIKSLIEAGIAVDAKILKL